MDIIYQRRQATAAEVMEHLPDPPSYSAVRALLRVLEEKGHVRYNPDNCTWWPIAYNSLPPQFEVRAIRGIDAIIDQLIHLKGRDELPRGNFLGHKLHI